MIMREQVPSEGRGRSRRSNVSAYEQGVVIGELRKIIDSLRSSSSSPLSLEQVGEGRCVAHAHAHCIGAQPRAQ